MKTRKPILVLIILLILVFIQGQAGLAASGDLSPLRGSVFKSPLIGSIFEPGTNPFGGYPGFQNPGPGQSVSQNSTETSMGNQQHEGSLLSEPRGQGFEGGTGWGGEPNGPPLKFAPPMEEVPPFKYGGEAFPLKK